MKVEIEDKLLEELEKAIVWEDGLKICGHFPTINGEAIDLDARKSPKTNIIEALIRSVIKKGENNARRIQN